MYLTRNKKDNKELEKLQNFKLSVQNGLHVHVLARLNIDSLTLASFTRVLNWPTHAKKRPIYT
jgi:hypothetical protein